MDKFKFGDKVMQKTTGFTGTVTGVAHYQYQTNPRYIVSAPVTPDNRINEYWIHAEELELVEE